MGDSEIVYILKHGSGTIEWVFLPRFGITFNAEISLAKGLLTDFAIHFTPSLEPVNYKVFSLLVSLLKINVNRWFFT